MAGETLTNLIARVYEAVGFPTDDGTITSSAVTSFLNRALERIATEKDWPWLEFTTTHSTAAGTATITPPTGWTRTQFLYIGSSELELRQRRDLIRLAEVTGRPTLYAEQGDTLVLAPTPNGVYTVNHGYIKKENVLSSGSDTTLIPTEYAQLVVAGAGANVARRLRDRQMEKMFEDEYARELSKVVDNVRRTAALGRVKRRHDWSI